MKKPSVKRTNPYWSWLFIIFLISLSLTFGVSLLTVANWRIILAFNLISALVLLGFDGVYCYGVGVSLIQHLLERKHGHIKNALGDGGRLLIFGLIFLGLLFFLTVPDFLDLQSGSVASVETIRGMQVVSGRHSHTYRISFCSQQRDSVEISYAYFIKLWNQLYKDNYTLPCTVSVDVVYLPHRKQIISITRK